MKWWRFSPRICKADQLQASVGQNVDLRGTMMNFTIKTEMLSPHPPLYCRFNHTLEAGPTEASATYMNAERKKKTQICVCICRDEFLQLTETSSCR